MRGVDRTPLGRSFRSWVTAVCVRRAGETSEREAITGQRESRPRSQAELGNERNDGMSIDSHSSRSASDDDLIWRRTVASCGRM